MRGAPGESDGYYGSLSCAREVAAVPASCMLAPRAVFERAGGFYEEYRARYHDVDFCLRVRGMGLGVVCSPGLREDVLDRALLVDSWFEQLDRGDPYLSSHLSAAMRPDEPGAGGRLAPLRRLARRR